MDVHGLILISLEFLGFPRTFGFQLIFHGFHRICTDFGISAYIPWTSIDFLLVLEWISLDFHGFLNAFDRFRLISLDVHEVVSILFLISWEFHGYSLRRGETTTRTTTTRYAESRTAHPGNTPKEKIRPPFGPRPSLRRLEFI